MVAIFKTLGILSALFGAFVLILWLTVIDFWTVPVDDEMLSASIRPTLTAGDLVVIAKDSSPDVPDLVRCVDPDAPERFVVARIIGKNSEKLTISRDVANAKNRREPSPHACAEPVLEVTGKYETKRTLECREEHYGGSTFQILRDPNEPGEDYAGVIDNGKVFLVSDNRVMHLDSRDYGAIEPRLCRRIYMSLWGLAGPADLHVKWMF